MPITEYQLRQFQRDILDAGAAQLNMERAVYVAVGQENKLRVQVLEKETLEYREYDHVIPAFPNYHSATPSSKITALGFFGLPTALESEPCLAVGLENGSFLLVTVSGRLLFAFCGFQHPAFELGPLSAVCSSLASRFVMAYALCLRHSRGVAFLTQGGLLECVKCQRASMTLSELSGASLKLEGGELRVIAAGTEEEKGRYRTQASLIMASFADLAEVPGEAEAFVDDTNVILLAPRPFLTRLVPLGRGGVCEVSAPFPVASLVQQLGPGHIPEGSCVSA